MIAKTRQAFEEVYDPEVGKARGILRRPSPDGTGRHSRQSPASSLASWIAHYWLVSWDLRGCEPQVVESLPHPNVHLVFEEGLPPVVSGVQTRMFTRRIEGKSQVFGVKFRPGGFRPFLGGPVSQLANQVAPASQIFELRDLEGLDAVAVSNRAEDEKVEAANAFFAARTPQPDDNVGIADQLVELILNHPGIRTVEDLAKRSRVSKRSLQRIFKEYVGASPKWVIRRYRLHELVEQLVSGKPIDWAQLALEFGYCDQAHLINDFRRIVGRSPTKV